jgi:tRNA(fMet)-specific endonuclease VapC
MEHSLLDSDILSELLRGKNSVVLRRGATYRQAFGLYTTSVVTVFEIISGFRQLRLESRIADFENSMSAQEVLPLDKDSALLAGRIHGDLVRTGQTIGRADPMIAAIALQHDLTLVTGNTQHFQRIIDLGHPLRLDDWRS